jgi:hypothetical protein
MINRIAGISLKRSRSDGAGEPGMSSFGVKDVKKFVEPVEDLIVKNPTAAVAAAFVVGVALAWWIKRSK